MEEIICENQPTNDEIDYALKGNIERLWNLISSLEGNANFMKIRNQIKEGIDIKFNIETIVRDYVEEYPDGHRVKIKGYKKINLDAYWDEIRLREKLAKNLLREIYDKGNQKEWDDK